MSTTALFRRSPAAHWGLLLPLLLLLGATAEAVAGGPANVYVTGADVRITAPVDGDLFAVAGRAGIDAPVNGDAVLGAGSIDVRSEVGDDLRAAGGIVAVTGRIHGEALIAGASISFGPQTEILGRARLAGRDVAVGGRLAAGLDAYGRNILLIGEIEGPLRLTGENIEIMPSARIKGDITYRSPDPIRVHPRARIEGTITREPVSFEFPHRGFGLPGIPFSPLLTFGLFATGILLLLLFPRFSATSQQTIAAAPVKSLGLGTAILFSLPPVILLLVITIVGIPVALGLAALYAIALLSGYLVTALFLGSQVFRLVRLRADTAVGWRIAALLAGLLLLWAARSVPLPYIGGLVLLLALVAGVGAMVLQAFTNYAERP